LRQLYYALSASCWNIDYPSETGAETGAETGSETGSSTGILIYFNGFCC